VLTFENFSLEILERRIQLLLWQIRAMSTLPSYTLQSGHYENIAMMLHIS
jgi:hypothetical protein